MLTDFTSLSTAWFAFRLSRRPADWKRTYGFDRFQVIVAFGNGLTLFFIAGWIVFEAVQRLREPVEVLGPVMAIVAAAGLLVNVAAFAVLHGAGADNRNLNMRGAMLHVMGRSAGIGCRAGGRSHHHPHGLDAGRSDPVDPRRADYRPRRLARGVATMFAI